MSGSVDIAEIKRLAAEFDFATKDRQARIKKDNLELAKVLFPAQYSELMNKIKNGECVVVDRLCS